MKKAVTTISGGMDSSILLHFISDQHKYDEIHAISYNYGQKHSCELEFAKAQVAKLPKVIHKVIDISFFKDIVQSTSLLNDDIEVAKTKDAQGHPQTVNYVPFRNLMLLSIACAYAESQNAETVYYGATQLDTIAGFWDGSYEFLDIINKVTALNRKLRIEIIAPLIKLSKEEIVNLGINLGVDFKLTHTCYDPTFGPNGEVISCGDCTACGGRLKGFIDAGGIDPIQYKINVPWEKYGCVKR